MNLKGLSVEDAKRKLEYYCSYQDRCYKEVITKLKDLGMLQAAVDHIIEHLVTHDFLNEERFAKTFARGKHRIKGWGKRRIERELKLREISTYNIKSAFKEIEEVYLSNFYSLADKKWQTINEKSMQNKKRKWVEYFMRKGYESHLIYDYLNELERGTNL